MYRRALIALGLIALVLSFVASFRSWFGGRGSKETPTGSGAGPGAPSPRQIDVEVRGVNGLILRSQGRKTWEIDADRLILGKTGGATVLEGLRKATYFRNDKPLLTLSAQLLRFNPSTKNFQISGRIQVFTPSGLVITTDMARWMAVRKVVVCPGRIEARFRNVQFVTRGLQLFPEARKVVCPSAVRVVFGDSLLTSRWMAVNIDQETVDFLGGVRMRTRVGGPVRPFPL